MNAEFDAMPMAQNHALSHPDVKLKTSEAQIKYETWAFIIYRMIAQGFYPIELHVTKRCTGQRVIKDTIKCFKLSDL